MGRRLPVPLDDLLEVARRHGTTLAAEWAGISRTWVRNLRKRHDGYDRGRGHPSNAEVAAWAQECPVGSPCPRCRQARQGSYEPLTDAERAVVEANTGLVRHMVYRIMRLDGPDAEEAIAAGMLGLMRAAQKFEPEKGFRFSTYAMPWIRQAIGNDRGRFEGASYRRFVDGRGDWAPALSLDAPTNTDDERTHLDRLVAADRTEDVLEDLTVSTVGQQILANCRDDLDRRLVIALADGDRIVDVAREFGVSGQAVRMRIARLRERIGAPAIEDEAA